MSSTTLISSQATYEHHFGLSSNNPSAVTTVTNQHTSTTKPRRITTSFRNNPNLASTATSCHQPSSQQFVFATISSTGDQQNRKLASSQTKSTNTSSSTVGQISAYTANSNNNTGHINSNCKMSGGIRRTVSSASNNSSSSSTSSSNSSNGNGVNRTSNISSNTTKVNTQLSNCSTKNGTLHHNHVNSNYNHHKTTASAATINDVHKKLDRSYSEPAEKNRNQLNSSTAATNAPTNGCMNSAIGNGSQSSLQTSSRYKTELCRSYAEIGHCKYGDKCQFAHGDEELRTITRHPKFKTENCKSFHSTGFCPYGPRCHFIHNVDESKKSSQAIVQMNNNGQQHRLFDTNPLPIANGLTIGHHHHPTLVQSQSSGPGGLPLIPNQNGHYLPFVTGTVNNSTNLVRPKALSLGSYSLGSSGEISSPSSQSGSPTSLNSFFSEETSAGAAAFVGLNGFGFPGITNSRMSNNSSNSNTFSTSANSCTSSNTFSFSPDSAFEAFNPNQNHQQTNSSNYNSSHNVFNCKSNNSNMQVFPKLQSNIFNMQPQTSMVANASSCYTPSPEPMIADQTANSVISQLFNGSRSTSPITFVDSISMNDMIMSPITNGTCHQNTASSSLLIGSQQQQQQMLFYPTTPDSPVDSVASEIEALKLGENPTLSINNSSTAISNCVGVNGGLESICNFSPISSSTFSNNSSISSGLNGCNCTSNSTIGTTTATGSNMGLVGAMGVSSVTKSSSSKSITPPNNNSNNSNNNNNNNYENTFHTTTTAATSTNNIPQRLPIFTKIVSTNLNQRISVGSSPSSNQSFDSLE